MKLPGYNGRDKTFFFTTYEGFVNDVNEAANLPERADAGNVERRLLESGRPEREQADHLRSGDDAAESERHRRSFRDPFPEQQDSGGPLQHAGQELRRARAGCRGAEPGGRAGTFAYINNNFLAADGHDEGNHAQVQHQVRSHR